MSKTKKAREMKKLLNENLEDKIGNKEMKAIILAAGYGTRLGKLGENKPKAFMEVGGKPIIDYIIEKVDKINEIDRIIIVTNNKFYSFFDEWKAKAPTEKSIEIINDNTNSNEQRLGAMGDLYFALEKIYGDVEKVNDDLLVLASDNLFDFNLEELIKQRGRNVVGIRQDKKENLKGKYGVIELDGQGKVIGFQEKPEQPKSEYASMGIYLFRKDTLPLLKKYKQEGRNMEGPGFFLEWLYKQKDVYGSPLKGKWYDIGSLEALEQAKKEFVG
ncbi:nucleoside-diphosphate-sugar pyrophosphorylase [Candidatus Pacearchaeota archaeon ex4484_26]|nr:MAG: nucleoside-diphosphate-sugar pyrophosphorylase [Candidatus Pacearchaeota archaeon ex4484_26]